MRPQRHARLPTEWVVRLSQRAQVEHFPRFAFAKLLLREMLDRPEALRALFAEHVSPWLGVLADYIRLGKEEGRIWSNLDPEAYLLNTIHQVVSGIAVSEVFTDLYPESEPPASRQALQKRHIEEMVRMAHASLFLPRTPPEKQN